MQQRDGIAVGRFDCHRLATVGHGSGEDHVSRGRGGHVRAVDAGHVDAAMLTARIRIVAEKEWPEHFAGRRPRPGGCGPRRDGQHRRR
jgi:hypothetical protein